MAAMIRIAEVPARVAVGFTPGEKQKDGTYRVTTNDAHAWPEAWFAGAGWIRFEPTPRRDGQTVVPDYAATPGTPAPGEEEQVGANPTPTLGPDGAAADSTGNAKLDQLDRIENQTPVDGTGDSGAGTAARHRRSFAVAAVVALLVLLMAPRALYLLRRRRRWRSGGALSGWAQVCEDAVDLGHVWRPSDSPRAAALALSRRYELDATARAALGRLSTAAERARYARDGAGDVAGLAEDAAVVRTALSAAVTKKARWRAWLLPVSTLRWMSSGVGTFVADVLDRVDDLWSSVRRLRRTRTA
jgi:hypothetical protein